MSIITHRKGVHADEMQRRRPNVTYNRVTVPSGCWLENSQNMYKKILGPNGPLVAEFTDQICEVKPTAREIIVDVSTKSKREFDRVFSIYNEVVPDAISNVRKTFSAKFNDETVVFDPLGRRATICDLYPGSVRCSFSATVIVRCKGGPYMYMWINHIQIKEELSDINMILPELGKFKWLEIDEQRKYYENGCLCDEFHNSIVGYINVPFSNGENRICSFETFVREKLSVYCIPLSPKDDDFNSQQAMTGMDYDGLNYHYKVCMSDILVRPRAKDKFMNAVKEFLVRRALDVRGLWYDYDEKSKRQVARVHLVSSLEEQRYVDALFHPWIRSGSRVTVGIMKNVLTWRSNSSGNHRKEENDVTITKRHRHFSMMQKLGTEFTIKDRYSQNHEKGLGIMSVKLY